MKGVRTFILFHFYAIKLRRVYEQIDPVAMKEAEGYWSNLIEDYETEWSSHYITNKV
ncbi:hypothetical protein [Paenibacillus sp. IHBB 3054]|uniref:hypothetical protein n=1 Tax=Paenibacillus sp. IHBB 3054 TaxID=3425689 RepID=UPI003F675919